MLNYFVTSSQPQCLENLTRLFMIESMVLTNPDHHVDIHSTFWHDREAIEV